MSAAGSTAPFWPCQQAKLARGAKDEEHAMSQTSDTAIAVIGIDIGKNSFPIAVGDERPCEISHR
jgi:transposase